MAEKSLENNVSFAGDPSMDEFVKIDEEIAGLMKQLTDADTDTPKVDTPKSEKEEPAGACSSDAMLHNDEIILCRNKPTNGSNSNGSRKSQVRKHSAFADSLNFSLSASEDEFDELLLLSACDRSASLETLVNKSQDDDDGNKRSQDSDGRDQKMDDLEDPIVLDKGPVVIDEEVKILEADTVMEECGQEEPEEICQNLPPESESVPQESTSNCLALSQVTEPIVPTNTAYSSEAFLSQPVSSTVPIGSGGLMGQFPMRYPQPGLLHHPRAHHKGYYGHHQPGLMNPLPLMYGDRPPFFPFPPQHAYGIGRGNPLGGGPMPHPMGMPGMFHNPRPIGIGRGNWKPLPYMPPPNHLGAGMDII